MIVRRLAAACSALFLAACWFLVAAPVASAHATLVSTNPQNGEHLARPPAEVLLNFSENVTLVRNGFALMDPDGHTVGSVRPEHPGGKPDQVGVPMPPGLRDGSFVLVWRVVSADSHPVHGSFTFSVGNARAAPVANASAQGGSDSLVGFLFWTFRLISYAALALMVGGAFFVALCWPDGVGNVRVRRVLQWSWGASVIAAVAMFLLQGPSAAGSSVGTAADPSLLSQTLGTKFGIAVLTRIVLLVVLAIVFLRTHGRFRPVVALAGGAALALTWSETGHASVGAVAAVTTVADAVHLVAMSVWLGGLVLLAVFVLAGKLPLADASAVSERFSRTAFIAVCVLAVSGAVVAAKEIFTTPNLAGSRYLELLLFKLAGFGVVVCIAAGSRSVVRSRFAEPRARAARKAQGNALRRLRHSVGGEVAVASVVLGVAAALVSTSPSESATTPTAPPPLAARSGPYLDALALPSSGDVQVWVEPAKPGDNQVAINVRDERGVNRDVPDVTARLSARGASPIDVPLVRTVAGQFVADRVAIPFAGDWQLEISVRTTGSDQSTVDADVPVS
jgi:copper transport protein